MARNFATIVAVIFILEFYVYQGFRNIFPQTWLRAAYWITTLVVYIFVVWQMLNFERDSRSHQQVQLMISTIMIFMLPKLLMAIFLLTDDLTRILQYTAQYFSPGEENFFPSRRKFLSALSLFAGAMLSGAVIDGIMFGKYRHSVRRVKLRIKGLPENFRGYRIIQISDLHAGSFFNPEKLNHTEKLINAEEADLILFTGDLVNNYADEFVPLAPLFAKYKAKDGKFAVLGNHDYGSYGSWNSDAERLQNIPNLEKLYTKTGFRLLRNENVAIQRDNDLLYILGVENWGIKPFPQIGDLDKATAGVPEEAVKVLMSHDPSHFDAVVKNHPKNIQLTLSGHTHGMQFGIDLKNFRWSPVKLKYEKWADLYESNGKYLYVNRGFGVLAFPGRVGVNPEITVIELS